MTSGLLLRPRLLSALNQAIDHAQETRHSPVLLARPPIVASPDVEITFHQGHPLRETNASKQASSPQPHFYLHRWKRQRLHSIRFPYLACLLEGEMDWRIGITQGMAKSLPTPESRCGHFTLGLCAGQFILMPPGVPYSSGAQIHWERPRPEQANYRVLWMHLLPTGTFCHLSGALKGKQFYEPPLYVHDSRVHLLVEFLREELELRSNVSAVIASNQLHSLLLRVRREMQEQQPFLIQSANQEWRHESAQQDIKGILTNTSTAAVQAACTYIETHLHSALELEPIARQSFVSTSHLNRLFRREMGTSVMSYVIQRRMEMAQALLAHSQLPIHEVGRQIGYPNPSHFSQIFAKKLRQTPQEFRAKISAKSNQNRT